MRKIYSIAATWLMAAATVFGAVAQTSPDRVIIKQTNGQFKSYLAERIDELVIEKVEGEVKADVQVISFTEGNEPTVTVSVTRTPSCESFKIAVVPPAYDAYLQDDGMAAMLIDNLTEAKYYEDFTSGEMSGFDAPFLSDVTYTVFTVGYDKFGTACGVSKATFHTKKADIIGNPQVTAKVLDVQKTSFTIQFEGNADCGQYFLCAFPKSTGGLQAEFEMWGPMFGFNSYNEMIAQFAQQSHTGTYINQWTGMDPSTDYEVWIAIQDTKGNYAEPAMIEVTTASFGDEGTAEVEISIGTFSQETDPDTGEVYYLQQVVFTPNESCALYHELLIEKSYIDDFNTEEKIDGIEATGEDGVMEYLKADQPTNPYWNMYETDDWKWKVNPGTDYVAYAIAQNINKEWGPVAKVEFTTMGSRAGAPQRGVVPRAAKRGTTCGTAGQMFRKSMSHKNAIRLVK